MLPWSKLNIGMLLLLIRFLMMPIALHWLISLAAAQTAVDQDNAPFVYSPSASIRNDNHAFQKFTPSMACLTGVSIPIISVVNPRFAQGDTVNISINLRMSANRGTIAWSNVTVPPRFTGNIEAFFPGGVPVKSGSSLFLGVSGSNNTGFSWAYKTGNSYSGGDAYSHDQLPSGSDFYFRTYGSQSCGTYDITVTPNTVSIQQNRSGQVSLDLDRKGYLGSIGLYLMGSVFATARLTDGLPGTVTPKDGSHFVLTLSAGSTSPGLYEVKAHAVAGQTDVERTFYIQVTARPNQPSSSSGTSSGTGTVSGSNIVYGATKRVCAGASVDSGWAVIGVETDWTKCGAQQNDIWLIKNLNGATPGTIERVCPGFVPAVPSGWTVITTEPGYQCGSDHVTVIRKS